MKKIALLLAPLLLAACSSAESQTSLSQTSAVETSTTSAPASSTLDSFIVAGGCFWCVESDFEKIDGVIEAVSGYTGGRTDNPTYKQVSYTDTGHYEAVEITFNPAIVSYETLINHYWKTVDPTDPHGQFCDKGDSYRTAIFAREDQLAIAQGSLEKIKQDKPFSAKIVTPILPSATFYKAEGYHQDYYRNNPVRYKVYRTGCGRDAKLRKLWGKS